MSSDSSLISSFRHGAPYAHNKKLVCPRCSQFEEEPGRSGKITKPVFLVVRVNKKTGQKFLGCPNFPGCKYSTDVYSVRVSKQQLRNLNIDYADELRPF
jgi:hypothetical protein